LLFYQFLDVLEEYMEPGSYKFCYADTDSFMLALTRDELDDCVAPDKRAEWHEVIRPAWFATECKRSQKEPGLLKEEARIKSGWFLAPSPKCYILAEMEPNDWEREFLTADNPFDMLAEFERRQEEAEPEVDIKKRSAKGCKRHIDLS
jgi:hypothetical protein